jgi:DNA-binding transcriptional regulator YdaS (Cro superfamily)
MFTSDVLSYFGSPSAVAERLGITRQAVGQWKELVPPLSASRLSALSKGKLKFNPELYTDWNTRRSA